MVKRGMEWWDKKWARLDNKPSTTPYTQLSAALLAMGEPDASSEIRYLGRQRERDGPTDARGRPEHGGPEAGEFAILGHTDSPLGLMGRPTRSPISDWRDLRFQKA